MTWTDQLHDDPTPWLLEGSDPAVRAATLTSLLDRPADDDEVLALRRTAMRSGPIRAILDAQLPDGSWGRPGPGYTPKFTGTGWQLFFLDQLGALPDDEQVQRGCAYLMSQSAAPSGGLATASGRTGPTPASVFHCYNGVLLRTLIDFGHLDDPRVQAAVDWAAAAITGDGAGKYYAAGTSGPGFACGSNERKPCAWGAIKELLGLSRVPVVRRDARVRAALERGVELLFSADVVTADYPRPSGDAKPSSSWFKTGFPSGYVTDVLQNLQVLAELGHGRDPRLQPALDWLVSEQDAQGRWRNLYALNGKTTVVIEQQGSQSKWVTLRACSVLRSASATVPGTPAPRRAPAPAAART